LLEDKIKNRENSPNPLYQGGIAPPCIPPLRGGKAVKIPLTHFIKGEEKNSLNGGIGEISFIPFIKGEYNYL
jgi:hypothetical protein